MRIEFVVLGLFFPAILWPASDKSVLWAGRREGTIEAISMENLATVCRVRLPGHVESVASDAPRRRLFLGLPLTADPKGCCSVFALDLPSLHLIFLLEPALRATPAAGRVLTQRGNSGIEVFDSHSLARLPTLEAQGLFRLQPSPDGQWLLASTDSPRPSVQLVNLIAGRLVWRHVFGSHESLRGAWIGDACYLLSADRTGTGQLWSIDVDAPGLTESAAVLLPGSEPPECGRALPEIVAAGERLVVYEQFGHKLDRRRLCAAVPGGFVTVNPNTGAATGRLAAGCHFREIVGSPDGRYLYGLDVGDVRWKQVRLVKLDAASGAKVNTKILEDDVWSLTSGIIPQEMVGRLDSTGAAKVPTQKKEGPSGFYRKALIDASGL